MKEVAKINNEQEWEYVKNKINNPRGLVNFKRCETTKDTCINIYIMVIMIMLIII